LISVITSPIEAAKMAVNAPMTATVVNASTECAKRGKVRATRKTPAATIVAACIRALTGVGPSMASGSQVFDDNAVDGAVNGVANATIAGGRALRRTQTGQLQLYGLVMGIGVLAIVLVLYFVG
ncbi:unnamed protein product, partial [marine sediment metagenome]